MFSSRLPRLVVFVAAGLAAGLALLAIVLATPVAADSSYDPVFLLIDEDTIDNGAAGIEAISFNAPFCGSGDPSSCVNDDRADPGIRDLLFTRPRDITPHRGLVLGTGQVEDEGLFRFGLPDPQTSLQNGTEFTTAEFFSPDGDASDESNLDKIAGVVPLNAADITGLVGRTVCAVVYDSDISVDVKDGYGNLQGATLGVTAFWVTAASDDVSEDSSLPSITVDLLPSTDVPVVCGPPMPSE